MNILGFEQDRSVEAVLVQFEVSSIRSTSSSPAPGRIIVLDDPNTHVDSGGRVDYPWR